MYKADLKPRGFTIVELLVAITVAVILAAPLIGLLVNVTRQFGIISVRQNLNTNAQVAIGRINDDIRASDGIAMYNGVPDANAPQSLGDYDEVPGPDNQNYYWRFGKARLILTQPSRNISGNVVYTDMATLQGPKDTVVYYVKDSTLYRRLIPAPESGKTPVTCSPSVPTGGCNQGPAIDEKIATGLSTPDGDNSFVLNYYDRNGNKIQSTLNGFGQTNYNPYSNTQLISVELSQSANQTGQRITELKGGKVAFRNVSYSGSFSSESSINIGPGGANINGDSSLNVPSITTAGKISLNNSRIASSTSPALMVASNKSCGTGNNYSTTLCSTDGFSAVNGAQAYGDLCTRNQTAPVAGLSPGTPGSIYTSGLLPSNCQPISRNLPKFNKKAFVQSMTQTRSPPANCYNNVMTLEANTIYTGDVYAFNCTVYVQGNVYVKGNFIMQYSAKLRIDNSLAIAPKIVANGYVNMYGYSSVEPNAQQKGAYIVSFNTPNTNCRDSDTCDTITQNGDCVTQATCNSISYSELQNSLSTDGIFIQFGSYLPRTVVYAYFGRVNVVGNEFKVESISGQSLEVSGGAKITTNQQ